MFGQIGRWWRRAFRRPTLGQRGEAVAARYLARHGHRVVARGSRLKIGEIDLITVDGRTIVFVEVKTRRSSRAGHPAEAVTPEKQQKLTRLALGVLKRYGLLEYPARFDVVAVTWPRDARLPTIEHFVSAFEAIGPQGLHS